MLQLATREGTPRVVPNAPSDERVTTNQSAAPEARAVHNVDESPHAAASALRDVGHEKRTPDAIDERGSRAADAEPSSHGTTAQPSDTAGEAARARKAVPVRSQDLSSAELRMEQSESARPPHVDRRVKRTAAAAAALPETAAKDEKRGTAQQKALHRREAAEPLIRPSDLDLTGVRTDATLGRQSTGRAMIEPAAARRRERHVAAQVTPLPSSLPAPLQNHNRETNESAAPNVHVSIGRVEIRAVVAPSAPVVAKRVNAKAPAMSLSDYLKGRNGVQR